MLGRLTENSSFAVDPAQRDAWLYEINLLQGAFAECRGTLFLEFAVPRMGSRIDALVVCEALVFVIEFKVGAKTFERYAIEQVWDYALDLKNFHEGSHHARVLPVLVATSANKPPAISLQTDQDGLFRPVCVSPADLGRLIAEALGREKDLTPIDVGRWAKCSYRPTPTIIEAARALYAHHAVEAIKSFDADQQNLSATSQRIEQVIEHARSRRKKAICFITGVPGAGKTLVGLNVATRHGQAESSTHAVLLSGNQPLVSVLQAALVRDERERRRLDGGRRQQRANPVKQFIQNVHHFRDEAAKHSGPPSDHVVVFDEAQRAWGRAKTIDFMKRKKKVSDFQDSEPEYLLSYVDRHKDWAVVVCLVGGGQEIHQGEAGIGTWLEAVSGRFSHWEVYISPRLTDAEYAASTAIRTAREAAPVFFDHNLHLSVSMRSFRAENLSAFVKALLDRDEQRAREILPSLAKYPMAVTRYLATAKNWVRTKARGTERYGLLASAKAQRLKPHAIDVRVETNPVHWFLNGPDDVRSSYYLEDAATEFQVQGLEVDWACVSWDADLRTVGGEWAYHAFRGARWHNIKSRENRQYLKNAYRVLLTRARQGMVIFVPPGDAQDGTRAPAYYDDTFAYLQRIGIPVIE